MPKVKPVLLVVLDGWGIRVEREANAIAIAGTPNMDALVRDYPSTALRTSGLAVGLPEGQMGNSEVGHTNLGAGRIVYQDLVRINRSIEDGSFFQIPALLEAVRKAKAAGGAVHLMGLVSDGGVHSQEEHLHALLELARREGVARAYVHAFLDGRDTPPRSGLGYVRALEARMKEKGYGKVATVMGRFYAMDRDKRWDRVKEAFDAMVRSEGFRATSGVNAVEQAYARGETDEFVKPSVVVNGGGEPVARSRTATRSSSSTSAPTGRARSPAPSCRPTSRTSTPRPAPASPPSPGWPSTTRPSTCRPPSLPSSPPRSSRRSSRGPGLKQLRCAETEKYAHVTFFFNGGRETVFPGEDRVLVPSPRDVKTYDQKPEMSAREVTDKVVEAIGTRRYGFILVNFANPDMVGHTGRLDAAVKAVKVVDGCIGRLWAAAREAGMAMLVTADHGNCEMMTDPVTGEPHTAHTLGPVPFILADPDLRGARLRHDGVLADVAPTALQVLGLPQPKEMKGLGLLVK